jgi:hypothetical protein
MLKSIIFLIITISTLKSCTFSQIKEQDEIPNIRLSLSTEKNTWKHGEPALVKVEIENLSKNMTTLSTSIYFTINDYARSKNSQTGANGPFWSPVSLTKHYDDKSDGCQNDLTKERVNNLGDTNLTAISPPTKSFILQNGEKKEFDVNLAATCWNHILSSVYPNQDIFSLIDERSTKSQDPKTYKVYFEVEFEVGRSEANGIKTPLVKRVKSNQIKIIID